MGSQAELAGFTTGSEPDDRFKDKVLLPGFVEGHSHIMEGTDVVRCLMSAPAIAVRRKGRLVEGVGDIEAIVARLKQAEEKLTDPNMPLFAWGFDPLHIGGARCCARIWTASR